MTGPVAQTAVAAFLVALLVAPCHGAASAPDDGAARSQPPPVAVIAGSQSSSQTALPAGTIRRSIARWTAAELQQPLTSRQNSAATSGDTCRASMTEKIAWLYALVGGSILVVYGPQEKNGDVWTMDGKSETVAGAGAVILSFALLRDIRKKGW
jgi:hypothetical protein